MPFIFKIKFETTLRRMIVKEAKDGKPDLNFKDLEAKIRDMFHVSSEGRLVVTYMDQDNDVVTMGNDFDLHDACIVQRIDPLRMEVKVLDIKPVGVNPEALEPELKSFFDTVKKPLGCSETAAVSDTIKKPLGCPKTAASSAQLLSKAQKAPGSIQGLQTNSCGFIHVSGPLSKFRKEGENMCLGHTDHQRRHNRHLPLKGKMVRHFNNQSTTLKPSHGSKAKTCSHYCPGHKHVPCLSSNTNTHHSLKMLDSCFVQHLNFLDGGEIVVGKKFTKSWRLRNTGILPWPSATQLMYVGGDVLGSQRVYALEISKCGLLSGKEIDASADLVAPDRPGRFVSYWRLMVPTGQKFGQKIWVIIQAIPKPDQRSELLSVQSNKQSQGMEELTLLPEASCNSFEPSPVQSQKQVKVLEEHTELAQFSGNPMKSLTDRTCGDEAVLIQDSLFLSTLDDAALASVVMDEHKLMEDSVQSDSDHLTNENIVKSVVGVFSLIDRPRESFEEFRNGELLEDVHTTMEPAHNEDRQVSEFAEHYESSDCQEDIILGMLNSMGFTQRSLNLELLRKNKNDMQGIVDDLVVASEWDSILSDLEEMK